MLSRFCGASKAATNPTTVFESRIVRWWRRQFIQRYIADRFLPDKAIDLVDEAASRLAMEKESVPEPIDRIQRRLRQLELALRQLSDEQEKSAVENRRRLSPRWTL